MKGVQAVTRTLKILKAFTESKGQLGISEIAAACKLTPSTTHRLVQALVGGGFLEQDVRSSRYFLGRSVVVLGQLAQRNFGFDRILRVLEETADITKESVNFGVPYNGSVIVVLRVQSPHQLRFDQSPGARLPLHASAQGKALLAFTPERNQILDELSELTRLTPKTITGRTDLDAEFEKIRHTGYSTDDEESITGVRCVGIAILGRDGRPKATIAIQAPTVRMPLSRFDELGPLLLDQARIVADILRSDSVPFSW